MTTGLVFPNLDPVAFSIFGYFHIRWYALAYLSGFLGGWWYGGWLADLDRDKRPSREDIDNILHLLVLGVILGGRIGYVLFYNFDYYLENPSEIIQVWKGGMSFHGGLLGVTAACLGFAWRQKISPLALGDVISTIAPIGLFFGRIANFVNGELFGRVTTEPWGVIFPMGGPLPRHPSQIYEAFLEGICLFVILHLLARNANIRRTHGYLFGTFLMGYGFSRIIVEHYREPDPQIGFILQYFSMGQLLSLPMVMLGAGIIYYARRSKKLSAVSLAKG